MKKDKTFIKVFSLILFSIFLMAFSAGYSVYRLNNEIQTELPPSTGADDIGGQIEEEPQDPSVPSDPQPDEPESVPIYNNAFKCIEDAFLLIDTCEGYKITSSMTAITDILGIGSATQSVREMAMLSGDFYFKETYANCSTSLGENFYRYFYSEDNGENIEYRKTSSYDENDIPNWDKTVESATLSKDEAIEKYDGNAYDIFPIRSDSSNSRLIKFDRTSNDTYYIISTIFNTSMIPEKYIENAKKEGGLSDINYKSLTVTYYIEKATLYMRKIERIEEYSITKGITLNVSSSYNLYVNIIDQKIEPQKPSYCA